MTTPPSTVTEGVTMNQDIEAVRRDISALRNGLLYPWQHDAAKDRILTALDHLTKANEELRAEVERKDETIKRQAAAVRTLHHNEQTEINQLRAKVRSEYQASATLDSEREANAILTRELDEARATIASLNEQCDNADAAFSAKDALIDRLTKERDEAVNHAATRNEAALHWRDAHGRAFERLSAMQEAIDEAVRRAEIFGDTPSRAPAQHIAEPLRPFATKPEPEPVGAPAGGFPKHADDCEAMQWPRADCTCVPTKPETDPLMEGERAAFSEAAKRAIEALDMKHGEDFQNQTIAMLREWVVDREWLIERDVARDIEVRPQELRTALAARGGRVVFDRRDG